MPCFCKNVKFCNDILVLFEIFYAKIYKVKNSCIPIYIKMIFSNEIQDN